MNQIIPQALTKIVESIAEQIKITRSRVGNLSNLQTVNKSDIVTAINELRSSLGSVTNSIDDAKTVTTHTWSSYKIDLELRRILNQVNNTTNIDLKISNLKTELLQLLGKFIRYDQSMSLTDAEKKTARDNIGAMDRSMSEASNLSQTFINTVKTSLGYKQITGINITGDKTKTLTITFSDSSTLTSTFNDINVDPTKFNSIGFDKTTGILKATNGDGQSVNVQLDGRYVLISDLVNYVKTTDPRLSDSRNAKDVQPWAKANTKPEYTWSEIKDKPEVLKFGTSNEKGNFRVSSDNEMQVYDGTKWVTASGAVRGLVAVVTTDTSTITSNTQYVIVRSTSDLTLSYTPTGDQVYTVFKDTTSNVSFNTVNLTETPVTFVGTKPFHYEYDFDFLTYFNTEYSK